MTTTTHPPTPLDSAIAEFRAAETALSEITVAVEDIQSAGSRLDGATASLGDVGDTLLRTGESWQNVSGELLALTEQLGESAQSLQAAQPEALRDSVEATRAEFGGFREAVEELRTTVVALENRLGTTTEALTLGLAAMSDQTTALRSRVNDGIERDEAQADRIANSLSDVTAQLEKQYEAAEGRFDSIDADVDTARSALATLGRRSTIGLAALGVLAVWVVATSVVLIASISAL